MTTHPPDEAAAAAVDERRFEPPARQLRVVNAGSGYLSNGSLVQHFGLGAATRVDRLEITWPSGFRSEIRDLTADQRVTVTEGAPGAAAP